MTQLRLALFGPFTAYWGAQPVTKFPTDKVRALLAYLALEGERPLRRETLAALLWPDWTDKIAKRNLRQNLHRLNQLLDGLEPGLSKRLLTITRPTVQLNREWVSLDVADFEAAQTAIAQCNHQHLPTCSACREQLTAAADLIQGDLLAGLSLPDAPAFDDWLTTARERQQRRALHLLHTLADLHLQRGEYARAEAYATRQIALKPWQEEAHRQLMLALARQGRRDEALAQYEGCANLLEVEMGIALEPETALLAAQIAADALPRVAATHLHHFPVYLTPFVGRVVECAQIAAALQDTAVRLTTLTAPGGMGKTRLAVHALQQMRQGQNGLASRCPDGAYFVALSGITSAATVAAILAERLGLPPAANSAAQLKAYLGDKKLLLLLDDMAHNEATAAFLTDLLADAPGLRLLATAVAPLGIVGERLSPIGGLVNDGGVDSPAVQLFIQTARRVRHDFAPGAADEAAIIRICQQTGGSPLALETAGAWVRLLTCAQIAEQTV